MPAFSPNRTSARLLVDYAAKHWPDPADADKVAMVEDLFIKARSYALINKAAFAAALVFGLAVLVWPSVAVITADSPYAKALFQSAVVQTTVTGVAALAYALYSHYKRQQLAAENLMRYVLFSGDTVPVMVARVSAGLSGIDGGFDFGHRGGVDAAGKPPAGG